MLEPISLDSIFISVPAVSYTSEIIDSTVDFMFSTGGAFHIQSQTDLENSFYSVHSKTEALNIKMLAAYLKPYLKFNDFEGYSDSDIRFGGSWANTDIFNVGGTLSLRDFLFTDIRDEKVLALQNSEVVIDTVRMNDGVYYFDHYRADGFYGIFEMYDDGDNFTNMLRDMSSVDETQSDSSAVPVPEANEVDYSNPFAVMGFYLKDIARSYKNSSYQFGKIAIEKSSFDFNDYTPQNPFRYHLSDISLLADSLDSKNETISLKMGATLDQTGRFDGNIEGSTTILVEDTMHRNSGARILRV